MCENSPLSDFINMILKGINTIKALTAKSKKTIFYNKTIIDS